MDGPPICIYTPQTALSNDRYIARFCLCLDLLPVACLIIIICFDHVYQLQLVKPSWGSWEKAEWWIYPRSPTAPSAKAPLCASLSIRGLSSGNKRFLLYQETATQLVHCHTLTDFFPAIQFIIIVINYHLGPRWPFVFVITSVEFHAAMGSKVIWRLDGFSCSHHLHFPLLLF